MKKRMINSQISNYKTYLMYKRQMKTLAENVFKFNNLPEYIDVSYLNKTLLNDGAIAFFKDEVLGVIALPFCSYGKLDVYGRPNQIYVSGQNGYHELLDKDKYVIMYDNNGKYPLVLDIAQMAERVALAVRTQDVNIIHQRTPRIWKTSKDTEKSVKDLINEIDGIHDAEPMTHCLDDFEYVLREDVAVESTPIEDLLRNSDETDGDEIEVPKVVG